MAIQNRRGAYSDFDPTKLLPGEYAVVQTGDPAGTNGYAVYLCYASGVVKRLVNADELQGALDDFEVSWSDITGKPQIDTTLSISGAIPDSKVVGDALALRAPLASPALTGTPTAPTPATADNSGKIATTEFVKNVTGPISTAINDGLALKANINSPAFTGVPSAPTPAESDDSEKIATTEYVTRAIDTFTFEMLNALVLKAPVASPTFTGTPAAPTPSQSDNSTKIATTAFVKLAIGSSEEQLLNAIAPEFDTATAYQAGAIVLHEGGLYRRKNGLFIVGEWNDNFWEAITVGQAIEQIASNMAPQYNPNSTYTYGDYCIYLGGLYTCISRLSVTGTWDSSAWSQTSLAAAIDTHNSVVNNLQTALAPLWNYGGSYAVTYAVGDYVTRNGLVYVCKVAHSSSTWIAANWDEVTITDNLGGNITFADDGDGNITVTV